jgi:hypothetical protein
MTDKTLDLQHPDAALLKKHKYKEREDAHKQLASSIPSIRRQAPTIMQTAHRTNVPMLKTTAATNQGRQKPQSNSPAGTLAHSQTITTMQLQPRLHKLPQQPPNRLPHPLQHNTPA